MKNKHIEEIKRYFTMTKIAMSQYENKGINIQLQNLEKTVIIS